MALVCGGVLAGLAAWAVVAATPWSDDLAAAAPRRADGGLTEAALDLSRATAPAGAAIAAAVVALALLALRRWRDLALVAASTAGAGIIVALLKPLVDAERPVPHPLGPAGGEAFPSAHASSWAALVTAIVLVAPARSRALVALVGGALVLAIGASRIILGAHDPRDVVAGLALGVGWAALVALVLDARWPARRP